MVKRESGDTAREAAIVGSSADPYGEREPPIADVSRPAGRGAVESLEPSSALLRIDGLSRQFGSREVVRSLDLKVLPGERVAFRGPNGSGKTTVLRCVVGTLTPSSGRISIGGHDAGTLEARRLLGVSFSQERSFYLRLTGWDNLLFYAGVRGCRRKEAVRLITELSSELELGSILSIRVDRCSTGMVQQLAFARALIDEPELLLLDEPTRSLDHDAVARVWAAVDRRPKTALVIATHNEDDIERCDRRLDFPVT